VRRCAFLLKDEMLASRLIGTDLIALDALYHRNCLTDLYRRARKVEQIDSPESNTIINHGTALAELIAYIGERSSYLYVEKTERLEERLLANKARSFFPSVSSVSSRFDV